MSLPKGTDLKTPFLLFNAHPDDFKKASKQVIPNSRENAILKKAFFHQLNINSLQKLLIKEVYLKSNGKFLIERQNDADLISVMEEIFPDSTRLNFPSDAIIRDQVKKLNRIVLDYIVPMVISDLQTQAAYLKAAFNPMEIMPLPKNVSKRGSKGLPSTL